MGPVSLEGRRAWVTGAAAGIGAAVCARFAEAGAEVVATDIAMSDGLAELALRLPLVFKPFDLLDDVQLEACADEIEEVKVA